MPVRPTTAARVLEAISTLTRDNGWPPSIRELAAHVGLASPSTVLWHLRQLEAAGLLTRGTGPRQVAVAPAGGKRAEACETSLCGICGRPLGGRRHARFCSPSCRREASRRRQAEAAALSDGDHSAT